MYKLSKIFDVKNKKFIITGGYGYLGTEMCKALTDLGALVYILGRDSEKGNNLVKSLSNPQNALFVNCDLKNYLEVKKAFKTIEAEVGQIDVLINNANYGFAKKFDLFSNDEWNLGIDGTINNYFRTIQSAIKVIKKPGGRIINIASMYGMVSPDPSIYGDSGFDNPANYGAGKAAIIQLTKYLAVHLSKDGINVNSISPGTFPSVSVQKNQEFINQLNKKVPLNRIGKPKELIGAILLLSSSASSYINGHNLVVDGGWTIW